MNVEMLKFATTYYHATRSSEIDQNHTIGGSVCVGAELSESRGKYTFPPDLRIKISEDNFCVMSRAFIMYVFKLNVGGIFNSIVFLSSGREHKLG